MLLYRIRYKKSLCLIPIEMRKHLAIFWKISRSPSVHTQKLVLQ